jgi:hypothetical protein
MNQTMKGPESVAATLLNYRRAGRVYILDWSLLQTMKTTDRTTTSIIDIYRKLLCNIQSQHFYRIVVPLGKK